MHKVFCKIVTMLFEALGLISSVCLFCLSLIYDGKFHCHYHLFKASEAECPGIISSDMIYNNIEILKEKSDKI